MNGSVQELLRSFGQGSGLIIRVAKLIGNKNWQSAWLKLLPEWNSWYTIPRTYWQKALERSKEYPVNII